MPRIATAASADEEASSSRVDDLIQRGRSQGHLSLSDLRTAFEQAGLTPGEARSILRELSEAGVRLADEETELKAAPRGRTKAATVAKAPAGKAAATETVARKTRAKKTTEAAPAAAAASTTAADGDANGDFGDDDAASIEADVAAFADTVDLDDQTPAMGDSVHTYLKSIGRTSLLTAEQEVDLAKRIEAGLFAEHKLDTDLDLSPEFRHDLEMVAEDGRRAKSHMLEANLRLVVSVAKKYSDRGLSLLDVVQEGNLGLIRAVEKFDYTKGYKFSTYAMWWIRQAIQRGFADSARTIRLPVHVLEMLSKLSRVERDMHQRLGREPTPEELAVELDRTPDQIEELLRTSRQPISLDSTIGEDGETSIGDLIEDVDAPEASELVDRQLMAEQLRSALDALTPREATIMAMRFGLYDGNPHTLDEIGRALGLTRERIRQLEKQSLSKLRHPSRAQPLLDFAS
ncbi:RNA polymerase sigma factor [Trebonia kvetii]|uniref:RNA polymerase sigma factor n=1 Tax=Trebonia kvetii TaxID=2480626 RepID=A0A6P2C1T0_9ACTN|nr:RNA polymerase sigma factor [Trebonia kvetii]TVZ04917.1 RNA polymerase sigma factor [Trebonia kvetii]